MKLHLQLRLAITLTLLAALAPRVRAMEYNDIASGSWNSTNTWSPSTGYPALGDTAIVDSHTVTVTGAQPAVMATWVTRTDSTTGTLYYADSSIQTRGLNLAGGVLMQSGPSPSVLSNGVVTVRSNSQWYVAGHGNHQAAQNAISYDEIRDGVQGGVTNTGLLTLDGSYVARLSHYGAGTNFTGGWLIKTGPGGVTEQYGRGALNLYSDGGLGSGTCTVQSLLNVYVSQSASNACPKPARVVVQPVWPDCGVFLVNRFPDYSVTVEGWEIELYGGTLGFGPDGMGSYRGGHVYVVSNSTFYGARDQRWGSDNRIESEIRGSGRVTITATAVDHTTQPLWDGTYMLFRLSGNNTNFSGGIDHLRNRLYVEGANSLGTGPLLTVPTDLDSGLYFDRPGGSFDWTVSNDISGGRRTNVAITVENGAGTNTLTVLGTLDPGTNGPAVTTNSTGILRVDGSVAFGAGGRLRIHIAGTNGVAGVDFDRLVVDHDLTGLSNAVLEVNVNTNLAKNALEGQQFVIVSNATALAGTFASLQWNASWRGKVVCNDPSGTVKVIGVTSTPPPGLVVVVR